jgi:hypothetical protein
MVFATLPPSPSLNSNWSASGSAGDGDEELSKETSPNLKSRGSPPYINKKIRIHHVTLLHNQRTEFASFPHCDRLDYKDLVLGYKIYPITNHRTYPLMSSDQGNKNSTWAKTQRWKSAISILSLSNHLSMI